MTDAKPADRANQPDLVVGLGASSGGLEALQSFFAALPPDTGLAYVAIHQPDSAHEVVDPELLSKVTSLPISLATEGTRVVANHIYVAQPGVMTRLDGDTLRVAAATPKNCATQ